MDRRRLASIGVMAVAAFSSLATSSVTTPPPPSVEATARGRVDLTADNPIAVRELMVRVGGLDPIDGGQRSTLEFTSSAGISVTGEGGGEITYRVVRAQASADSVAAEHFGRIAGDSEEPPSWGLDCKADPCTAAFALIAEWDDPAPNGTATLDWNVTAGLVLVPGLPAGAVEPRLELTTEDPESQLALVAADVSPDPIRLNATHRLALWRVSMQLGDGALETSPGWPLVAYARLTPTPTRGAPSKTQSSAPARPVAFIEGVEDRDVGYDMMRTGAGMRDGIAFEPFWSCEEGRECVAEYVIGVYLNDSSPEAEVDAGWSLEIRAIGTNGLVLPVEVAIEPVPEMPFATGSVSGTLVFRSDTDPTFRYRIEEAGANRGGGDDQWDGLRLPRYGVWRAVATSTGDTPVSPNGLYFGPFEGFAPMLVDTETSVAFIPSASNCRVGDCRLEGELVTSFRSDGFPTGWELTIDWVLEFGVGTVYPAGQTGLRITELPE